MVIIITATMMVIEIIAGVVFGSMALLADGLHMGSHTAALGLSVFAYVYARRHADDERLAEVDLDEVDVLDVAPHRVALDLLDDRARWFRRCYGGGKRQTIPQPRHDRL